MNVRFLVIGILLILGAASGMAQVDHFAISSDGGGVIPDTTAGTPLFIQIIAQDSVNGTVTSFTGTVDVTTTGTFLTGGGTTDAFIGGILTGYGISFSGAGSVTVTATETAGEATGTSSSFTVLNPLPSTSSIAPDVVTTGAAGFTLIVNGANFVPTSVVRVNGNARSTTFVSTAQLTAAVLGSDISTAGSFLVTVVTPAPGGGTSGSQTVSVLPPVVNAKAYLEGAWNGATMNTSLRTKGFVPLSQPYSGAPWSYTGTEHVAAIPAGVVDWVLVELRTGTTVATRIARRAAFLTSTGAIVDTGGTEPVTFLGVGTGSYRIVVVHRNHLPVMSAAAVALDRSSALYDFTASAAAAFGAGVKPLSGGHFGLYAGDYSRDGFIDASDFTGPDNDVFLGGYRQADLNLDGFVDASDFLYPDNNVFTGTKVPQ